MSKCKDFDDMTKAELVALIKELGGTASMRAKKDTLRAYASQLFLTKYPVMDEELYVDDEVEECSSCKTIATIGKASLVLLVVVMVVGGLIL